MLKSFREISKVNPPPFDIRALEKSAGSQVSKGTGDSGVDVNELVAKFRSLGDNTEKARHFACLSSLGGCLSDHHPAQELPLGTILTDQDGGHDNEGTVKVRRSLV
ncbi:hypothetical protein HWV62_15427 [Athelia sp. TMB]|nr:hypothetical protein HWV62_15427 [Athelia sp. TMB]